MSRREFDVEGMSCGGCEENVSDALTDLDGVESVAADHEGNIVTVTLGGDVADDDLTAAIESAGYEVVS
ncbi:heavy-metal-associated domain-containing protein [Natronoarchaeum sp. GCM10025703]|uniref:heavy-metal-associated domain-containing protein n=1 Tax=unclassified Natronoarchaeum TaxID=2620183 RepID=UPI0036080900